MYTSDWLNTVTRAFNWSQCELDLKIEYLILPRGLFTQRTLTVRVRHRYTAGLPFWLVAFLNKLTAHDLISCNPIQSKVRSSLQWCLHVLGGCFTIWFALKNHADWYEPFHLWRRAVRTWAWWRRAGTEWWSAGYSLHLSSSSRPTQLPSGTWSLPKQM